MCTTNLPGVYGGQKMALDPLDLELQMLVSQMETEPRSTRVISALNH